MVNDKNNEYKIAIPINTEFALVLFHKPCSKGTGIVKPIVEISEINEMINEHDKECDKRA